MIDFKTTAKSIVDKARNNPEVKIYIEDYCDKNEVSELFIHVYDLILDDINSFGWYVNKYIVYEEVEYDEDEDEEPNYEEIY